MNPGFFPSRDQLLIVRTATSFPPTAGHYFPFPSPPPPPQPQKTKVFPTKFLEIDEAWFGGDDKKRHRNKKFGNHWRKGRVLAVGGVDRDTGRADAKMILKADHETVAPS